MGIIFNGLFWGTVLIFIGVAIILKIVLHVEIPIVRTIFAILLILLGIRILFGGFQKGKREGPHAFMDDTRIRRDAHTRSHNVIFGKGRLDLSEAEEGDEDRTLEINTVFGSTELFVDPDRPVRIRIDAAFAGATIPDGNVIAFGSYDYRTPGFDPKRPRLDVEAHVVFGSLTIVEKKRSGQ